LQSVIRCPYPICIHGIVKNDIRIYPYPQKFTDIRKYLSKTNPNPKAKGNLNLGLSHIYNMILSQC